jgi:hypothetical protein
MDARDVNHAQANLCIQRCDEPTMIFIRRQQRISYECEGSKALPIIFSLLEQYTGT